MDWKTVLGGAIAGGALTGGLAKELMDPKKKKGLPPGAADAAGEAKTPSYKKGTKRVPKTGVAKLHKGEAVLNKAQAKRYRAGGLALGGPKKKAKIKKTMDEWKSGTLHSGSKKGPKVTNQKQAVAIALSQARKEK
jgi:Family of unknown function (DUF6496)